MGLTLMSVGLRFIGMSLSVIGVIGAISIYRVELQQLRLRIEENGVITLLSAELWIILGTILMALLIPAYVWYHETRPVIPVDLSRHLNQDQRARMAPLLRLEHDEIYEFQINSVQNCEECEDYAEELRK